MIYKTFLNEHGRVEADKLRVTEGWTRYYVWPADVTDLYQSVTSITGDTWPKPWMRAYSMNQVVDAVCDNLKQFDQARNAHAHEGADSDAYKHNRKNVVHSINETYARARDTGTYVHGLVEFLHTGFNEPSPFAWMTQEDVNKCVERAERFSKWLTERGFNVIESEVVVYNEDIGYAGTVDLLCDDESTGALAVVDLKTGRTLGGEFAAQVAAYANATHIMWSNAEFETMPPIEKGYVAHCKLKSDTLYEVDLNEAWQVWQQCVNMLVAYRSNMLERIIE